MKARETVIVLILAVLILTLLALCLARSARAAGECELIAEIQPNETENRVEYTDPDPQGRELCRLKIYLHDRTVIGFAPPGGEHDGYAASFNGAHVEGHRVDPDVDLISHAQVFAVENSIPPTATDAPPTATDTLPAPTFTVTLTEIPPMPPTATGTLTLATLTPVTPTLIPPVEITPTATDTPTVDIYYPPSPTPSLTLTGGSPPGENQSPPAPRLPETGGLGKDEGRLAWVFALGFALVIGFTAYKGFRKG